MKKQCPCFRYRERKAFMQESGVENFREKARADTCRGCDGQLGIGLFEKVEVENDKEKKAK